MSHISKNEKLKIYLFNAFLIKKNLLNEFIFYYYNPITRFSYNYKKSLTKYLQTEVCEDFLDSAYDWEKTNEGHEFWDDLCDEWRILLYNMERDKAFRPYYEDNR